MKIQKNDKLRKKFDSYFSYHNFFHAIKNIFLQITLLKIDESHCDILMSYRKNSIKILSKDFNLVILFKQQANTESKLTHFILI